MLIKDPDLSRKAAAAIVTDNSVDTLNAVGGFDTVYGGIIILAILICLIGYNESLQLFKRNFVIALILTSCVFIVMSSYGTALVMMSILFIFVLIEKNQKLYGFIGIFTLVLCLVFHKQIGYIFIGVSRLFGESFHTLSVKINQIGYMFITGESGGTLAGNDGRLARMGWSWNAFISHPFHGSILYPDIKIGGHSEILDILARFGIFGFISIFSLFVLLYKDTISMQTSKRFKKYTLICYALYFIIAILNPAIYTQQLLPFFIIIPFIEEIAIKKEDI